MDAASGRPPRGSGPDDGGDPPREEEERRVRQGAGVLVLERGNVVVVVGGEPVLGARWMLPKTTTAVRTSLQNLWQNDAMDLAERRGAAAVDLGARRRGIAV